MNGLSICLAYLVFWTSLGRTQDMLAWVDRFETPQ